MLFILKLMLFWQERTELLLAHPCGYAMNQLFIYLKFRPPCWPTQRGKVINAFAMKFKGQRSNLERDQKWIFFFSLYFSFLFVLWFECLKCVHFTKERYSFPFSHNKLSNDRCNLRTNLLFQTSSNSQNCTSGVTLLALFLSSEPRVLGSWPPPPPPPPTPVPLCNSFKR